MDRANLGRAIERYLRCTGDLVNACSLGDASNTGVEYEKALSAYNAALDRFEKDTERHCRLAQSKKIAALAKDWLGAFQDVQVFDKLPPLLMVVQRSAEVAALSTTSPVCRHSAVQLVAYASSSCFMLLGHACEMVVVLRYHGGSSVHEQTADRAAAALWDRGLVDAVAAAALSVVATGQRELRESTATTDLTADDLRYCLEVVGDTALAVNRYLFFLADDAGRSLTALCTKGRLPAQLPLPPEAVRALEALADSQLLAAAATSLVDSPAVSTLQGVDHRVLYPVQSGCKFAGNTLLCMQQMQLVLYEAGGPEAQRLACGLLRAMRHVAVRRLQVALLDQLAVHAGMGPAMSEEGRRQEEEAGEQQQVASVWEAGGWAGSSGAWWFAREEAQQGQMLGMDPAAGDGSCRAGQQASNDRAGVLEDFHCHIVQGTFGSWGGGVQERAAAAAAGVPVGPPPLLAARLAARAAEAVCRLCRGQGLKGAYAPAPEWKLAMAPNLVRALLPSECWDSLPAATARLCAPHWLEAAGWLAALMSDATAAAMGRLPAAQRPEQPRSYVDLMMVEDGSQAGVLVAVVEVLANLVRDNTHGFKTLPADAQDDARRRMVRCGLAASLEHTLRLLFSAQDLRLTGQTAIAKDLGKASLSVSRAIEAVLEHLPPPVGGQEVEGQGGGQAAGRQLGLLLTVSKRAAVVARALEAGEGAGAQQQWVDRAAEVLALLTAAAGSVEGDVRDRVAAKAAVREAAATGSGAGDGGGEECIDESHEALVLAARAASCLAAPLAWRLATEMGTAAAAGGPTAARDWAAWQAGTRAVCGVLACALRWWCDPPLLPPAQLLACQPHRLLAAACTLAAALPVKTKKLGKHKQRLCALVASTVAVLASLGTVSGRVRGWLVLRPAAAATVAGTGDPGGGGSDSGSRGAKHEADPCAGCLVAPLLALVRQAADTAPSYAAHTAALLRLAGGGEGTDTAAGEADGGFRRFAQEVAEVMVADSCRGTQPRGHLSEVPMSDGSLPSGLLLPEGEGDGAGGMPAVAWPPPPAAAPPGALPPPLTLQPSRQGAMPRLRVCGNPRCGNFAEESEGALPFKQCGGCRAVRYCGPDCQRAHWREGHRAECKLLAAGS